MFNVFNAIEIRSIEMELPLDIKELISAIKEYSLKEEERWYESLGDNFWYVKCATEQFTFNGIDYILYPEVVCKTQAFFEHIMIHKFEAELLEIGATNVQCTGTID